MLLGVLLTINQTIEDNIFFQKINAVIEVYWPLTLSFIGIYLVSTPKKRKK